MKFNFFAKQVAIFAVFAFVIMSVSRADADAPTFAPNNVWLTDIGFSEITVNWSTVTADPALTNYRIDRESPVGGGFITIANPDPVLRSHKDMGLSSGATYGYRVAAVNASGTGSYSSQSVYATTLAPANFPPPGRPYNLKATAVSGSEIHLVWTAPVSSQPITGYKIERGTGSGFSIIAANTNSLGTTYGDTNLSSGATYVYRVSAINAYGTSEPSFFAHVETLAPPTQPQNARAIPGNGEVAISWTEPFSTGGGVSEYLISGGPTSTSVSGNVTSTVISGLTNGTAYYFKVSAKSAAGISPEARAVTVVPLASLALKAVAPQPAPEPQPTTPSISDLEAQIKSLLALIESLKLQIQQAGKAPVSVLSPRTPELVVSPPTPRTLFSRDLYIGLSGGDVRELQKIIISENHGPSSRALAAARVTGYFGPLTQIALSELQAGAGIDPPDGYFGSITRAYVNDLYHAE